MIAIFDKNVEKRPMVTCIGSVRRSNFADPLNRHFGVCRSVTVEVDVVVVGRRSRAGRMIGHGKL